MPKIPVTTLSPNDIGINTAPLQQAAYRDERRGLRTAADYQQGFEKLGSGIVSLGEGLDQHTFTDYVQKSTQFEIDEEQRYQDAKANKDPNDPQWLPTYLSEAKARRDDFDSQFNFLTTKGRQEQVAASDQWFKEAAHGAIVEHAQLMADQRAATGQQLKNVAAADAQIHPETLGLQLDKFSASYGPLVGHNQKEVQSARSDIAYSVADNIVRTQVAGAQDKPAAVAQFRSLLDDPNGPYVKNITPEQRNALNDELDKIAVAGQGIQFGLLKGQLPSLYEAMDKGSAGATKEAADSIGWMAANATTKEDVLAVAEARREYEQHKAAGTEFANMTTRYGDVFGTDAAHKSAVVDMTNREAAIDVRLGQTKDIAEIKRLQGAKAGIAAAKSILDSTWNANRAAFNADPAGYAIQRDSVVSAATQAFLKNPAPDTWENYKSAQQQFQRQFTGLSGYVPTVTTQGMRDEIGAAMRSITTDANGTANASHELQKWATITGSDWTNVAGELMAKHVINEDAFAAASIVGKPSASGLIDPLLSASRMTAQQRYDLHGIDEKKARYFAVRQLAPLAKSLANIPNAASVIGAYETAVTHLLQVRGNANALSGDAKTVANAMVLDEYDFRDGGNLRIPKGVGDPDSIERGATRQRDTIGATLLDVPRSFSGLGAADQHSEYVRFLQANAHWYATPDGKGATLYPSPGASTPVTVKGKPLTLSWKQLHDMGQ